MSTASIERFAVYQAAEWQVEITSSWRRARRQMPILWFHGFGVDGRVARRGVVGGPSGAVYYDGLSVLAERLGTCLISADYGGINTWANDTAIARVATMLTWANTNLGTRTDRYIVGGESMGTLLALNIAWRNLPKIAAVFLRGPITRMQTFHDLNPALGAFMEAAYTNLAGLVAAYPTHDPAQNMFALRSIGDVTRLDATTDDELIPATWATDYAAATGALARLHPGTHADNTRIDHAEVAEWLADVTRTAA